MLRHISAVKISLWPGRVVARKTFCSAPQCVLYASISIFSFQLSLSFYFVPLYPKSAKRRSQGRRYLCFRVLNIFLQKGTKRKECPSVRSPVLHRSRTVTLVWWRWWCVDGGVVVKQLIRFAYCVCIRPSLIGSILSCSCALLS